VITLALVLSGLALGISLCAVVLCVLLIRQTSGVATLLQRHRLGHEKREGALDPAPHTERRKVNLGPPRRTPERREGPGRLLPPEEPPDAELVDADTGPLMGAPTVEAPHVRPKQLPQMPRLPRPGQIGQS
jgi:hypothetical protein